MPRSLVLVYCSPFTCLVSAASIKLKASAHFISGALPSTIIMCGRYSSSTTEGHMPTSVFPPYYYCCCYYEWYWYFLAITYCSGSACYFRRLLDYYDDDVP